ncbi:MAG: MFS transporter [Magnetospirillum sp.]|nr:MFS transporter [Magnetospirillum sp.]
MTQSLPAPVLALRVLLPFAAGYFLSYLYRTVNAVLAPEIARSIELDAGDIGLMTGVYFITFGAFQLPLGILLDRFGPRRVEALLLLFAALGAATFALAESVPVLVAGRALVGLGVASCLMAPLKANVQWFERSRLPLMNGVILGAGGLGAVAATAPVQAALSVFDWRGVYAGLAVLTLAAAAVLWRTVPDKPMPPGGGSLRAQVADVLEIFRNRLFWRIAPISAVSMGSFMAIQGLWAGPWLRDVAGLSSEAAAGGLTVMAAAMALGYLSMGAIAERLGRLGISTVVVGGAGMTVFALATLVMAAGGSGAPLLLSAVYGFFGTSSAVNYAVLTQIFPVRVAGRVNTSLNLTMFLTAFAVQWGLGVVIRLWPAVEGRWPAEAYGVALAIPAVLQGLALLWFIPAARTARPQ